MIDSTQLQIREIQLLAEIAQLLQEVESLRRANRDLELTLSTTAEHGDTIETQLHETNVKLQAEIAERQRAEAMLQALLDIISRERDDLKIIVQTIIEHGDVLDLQWHQKLSEATSLASLDGLTQIANRRRFDEYLEYVWKEMARQQAPLSIALLDIDYFKQYNDTYGHLAGDNCLKQVAQALSSALYRPGDLLARYGGEEFVVILPQTMEVGAIKVAERMQAAIAQLQIPHTASGVSSCLTLSIGIACTIPCHGQLLSSLLDSADRQLYLAKQQGRNRIVCSTPDSRKDAPAERLYS